MVPFQALLMVGHTGTPPVLIRNPAKKFERPFTISKGIKPTSESAATISRST